MKNSKVVLLIGIIAVLLVATFLVINPAHTAKANNVFDLRAPQFITEVKANSTESFIGDKLDDEAGISAYYKAPDVIDLNDVRSIFRTIEMETSEFIIGSVAVPNYPEHYDVHVYVNTNGWILSYYLKEDNVGKIADVYNSTINTTQLATVTAIVASAAGAPFTEATYYDFRYPSATNMLLVYEDYENGNDFTIMVPSSYLYYERGWAINHQVVSGYYFNLDGVILSPIFNGPPFAYGEITAGQLQEDVTHSIIVSLDGIMIVIYRVP
jgi:hypothetical protein